jgi:hypothetical protein
VSVLEGNGAVNPFEDVKSSIAKATIRNPMAIQRDLSEK